MTLTYSSWSSHSCWHLLSVPTGNGDLTEAPEFHFFYRLSFSNWYLSELVQFSFVIIFILSSSSKIINIGLIFGTINYDFNFLNRLKQGTTLGWHQAITIFLISDFNLQQLGQFWKKIFSLNYLFLTVRMKLN